MDHIFSDGTTDISITSGVIRIDFFRYAPGKAGVDGKPEREFSHRMLMPPEGFLQMYTAADEVVRILIERGLIQRVNRGGAEAAPAPAAAPASAQPKAPAPPPISPNF